MFAASLRRWTAKLALPAPPGQCVLCRQWGSRAFCVHCVDRFAAPVTRCARCGERTGTALPACGRCLHEQPPYTLTVCAVDYGFPWAGAISAFKFHAQPELAASFAHLLQRAVLAASAPMPNLVVPVPLSEARQSERGYNQSWEVARRLAEALGVPAESRMLLRHMDTPHQLDLSRAERQRNLRQAFMVDPGRRHALDNQHVALVDDVMTTGATLAECSACLLRAGAARVDVWVLARTPVDAHPH